MPEANFAARKKRVQKGARGAAKQPKSREKPKSEARAEGHVTTWLARFFVLRGSVNPPQLTA